MFGLGFFWWAERKHLDLVEPVDPEDSAGVLAVTASFTAKARRISGVPKRKFSRIEHLIHVVSREWHFGCSNEVHVVGVEAVDVLGSLPEKSRSLHRRRIDQRRWDDRNEPVLRRHVDREIDQRKLELSTNPSEVVEAAAGHLGAALDVYRLVQLPEFEVVLGSNPSAAKSRGVPISSSTTKSSSPPIGAAGSTTLDNAPSARSAASSASRCACSVVLTASASS